jgi:hypothetical protein
MTMVAMNLIRQREGKKKSAKDPNRIKKSSKSIKKHVCDKLQQIKRRKEEIGQRSKSNKKRALSRLKNRFSSPVQVCNFGCAYL